MKTDSTPQQDTIDGPARKPPAPSAQGGLQPGSRPALVKSEIEAALQRTSIADARTIIVAVRGSDVTLTGTVHGWDERATANHAAWSTPGVRNVIDMMSLAR